MLEVIVAEKEDVGVVDEVEIDELLGNESSTEKLLGAEKTVDEA